jgi:hypothetical protein
MSSININRLEFTFEDTLYNEYTLNNKNPVFDKGSMIMSENYSCCIYNITVNKERLKEFVSHMTGVDISSIVISKTQQHGTIKKVNKQKYVYSKYKISYIII